MPPENEDPTGLVKNDGKDMDRVLSWMGRLEKENKDLRAKLDEFSSVRTKIDEISERFKPKENQDDLGKRLHERILEGDVMGALSEYEEVRDASRKNLAAMRDRQIAQAMASLSDDPVFQNSIDAVRVEAGKLAESGIPANVAVELAKERHHKTVLEKIIQTNGFDVQKGLGMLQSGTPRVREPKETTLPPNFQKEFDRGVRDGLWKDRAEYIESMDPRVRAALGA